MSQFPFILDDDSTIYSVSDNITEVSGQNFNQVRDAIFRIEEELGIKPSGAMTDLNEFLNVSFNTNGTIKASALTSVGLATLPIDNAQVGANAGILESKLSLDYTTSSLRTLIATNTSLINSLQTATSGLIIDLNAHIGGGSAAVRHVGSHIDINSIPIDSRDPTYSWTGLLDTSGNVRSATNVSAALLQINNELVGHETAVLGSHPATAVSVDTSDFSQLSAAATNVQLALNELDASEDLRIGIHRATQHSAGVPADSRSESLITDGYGDSVVSSRQVQSYVANFPPGTGPQDDTVVGDNIIRFIPPVDTASLYQLDAQFSQVKPGDILRIRYGDGYNYEAQYFIDSIRYTPETTFVVRVDCNNLVDTTDAYARIDRPLFDSNVYAVAMSAPCNADLPGDNYRSLTVVDPRSASVLGIGFDPNQINSTHYKLYLELYPNGNPLDKAIVMPAIDISGNAGITPGKYTLDNVVLATNNAFRASGYNLRFVAFQYEGNFGIALADPFNGAAFSIVSGDWSSGVGVEGAFTENVIGDLNVDGKYWDALGLSANAGNWASPAYRGTYVSSTDAQTPTKIFMPRKSKYYIADGSARDYLKSGTGVYDGYWVATLTNQNYLGSRTETTYTIDSSLASVGLKAGKTITVLPVISITDSAYNYGDYGRFIIKSITYPCGISPVGETLITVIDGVHADGYGSAPGLLVRIHFGNDTVGFDSNNVIDSSTPGAFSEYHRFHEVYANKNAKTMSHERARLPIHSGGGAALDTTYWHINYISPKLRGYKDNTVNLNKYIRLRVYSYDATSGEYTARIGRRSYTGDVLPPMTTTLLNYGELATGRKNVPCKIYDETGNDYIEVEFVETSSAATAIVPSRVADIELFPSLMEDDELTLIATCEVNTASTLVERVIDRRQVGSISESEFTTSAKDYITAVSRAITTNGVIRGLECLGATDLTDPAAIYFNGGEALVNGKVVVVNNGKVIIPDLSLSGGGSTVEWVICVNEEGVLVSLPLTTAKDQFFALALGAGTAYYIPSVSFLELITQRKDLVVLATMTSTITPVAITDVLDLRRFVANQAENIPFVWSEDETNSSATFTSAEALQNWVSRTYTTTTKSFKQKIIVRGYIYLTTALDFRNIPNLVLEGEGPGSARINVSSTVGIYLNSNATIRNIEFIYDNTSSTSNNINISLATPLGCLVIQPTASSTARDINIEDCWFIGQTGAYRNPLIYMLLSNNTIDQCHIVRNKFLDMAGYTSAAIVIAEANTNGAAHSILNNVFIEDNICSHEQGIFITGQTTTELAPIEVVNVHMSKNKCGYIGVSTSSDIDSDTRTNIQGGLVISGNACNLIYGGNISTTGALNITTRTAIGNVNVHHNVCGNIYFAYTSNTTPRAGQSALTIDTNTLVCTSYTAPTHVYTVNGIVVYDAPSSTPYLIPAKITNNTFKAGSTYGSSTVLQYEATIIANSPAIITGNVIRAFTQYGIYTTASTYIEATGSLISHNYLFRGSNSVLAYIYAISGSGIISENYFDSMTIDGADYTTINLGATPRSSNWVVSKNKNHVNYFYPKVVHGTTLWLYSSNYVNVNLNNSILWSKYSTYNSENIAVRYDSSIGTTSCYSQLCLPLLGIIPDDAYVISATITAYASTTATTVDLTPTAIYHTSHSATGIVISSSPTSMDFSSSPISQTAILSINRRVKENLEIDILAHIQASSSTSIYFDVGIMYTF
jgi:hypothetical protein